jgi:uncharacterized membrane protein
METYKVIYFLIVFLIVIIAYIPARYIFREIKQIIKNGG